MSRITLTGVDRWKCKTSSYCSKSLFKMILSEIPSQREGCFHGFKARVTWTKRRSFQSNKIKKIKKEDELVVSKSSISYQKTKKCAPNSVEQRPELVQETQLLFASLIPPPPSKEDTTRICSSCVLDTAGFMEQLSRF